MILFSVCHLIQYRISWCRARHLILRFGRRNKKPFKSLKLQVASIAPHGQMMANIWHWAWQMARFPFETR